MTPSSAPRQGRSARWLATLGVATLGLASLALGATLGSWQWTRAHAQAAAVEPQARAPLAEVMRPGEAGRGEGRLIAVEGAWADADAALVDGREVDGEAAVLLVRAFTVPGSATGTGQPATLPVLVGWAPPGDLPALPGPGEATVTGYVRGGEGAVDADEATAPDGAFWARGLSTAALAQEWPSPVYSYLVVADDAPPGWQPLPPPEQRGSLDVRSVTYAVEWWVFGLFGVALAGKWIRDNRAGAAAARHTSQRVDSIGDNGVNPRPKESA